MTHTTLPDDLTPLNREKYNMTKTQKQQATSSGRKDPMSVNPVDLLICRTRRLSKREKQLSRLVVSRTMFFKSNVRTFDLLEKLLGRR